MARDWYVERMLELEPDRPHPVLAFAIPRALYHGLVLIDEAHVNTVLLTFPRDPTAAEELELRRMGARPAAEGRPPARGDILTADEMSKASTDRRLLLR